MESTHILKACAVLAMQALFVSCSNYYFVTHRSYLQNRFNLPGFFATHLIGYVSTVTQQCRRTCSFNRKCGTYRLTLLSGTSDLGVFECRLFVYNACTWESVSLLNSSLSTFPNLWEKLDADSYKPKPCVEYCKVKYKGQCEACRGFSGLDGLDCDIAPKLCSDYQAGGWAMSVPLWPWGFYSKKIVTSCYYDQTLFFTSALDSTGLKSLFSLGWEDKVLTTSAAAYLEWQNSINWEIISELVSQSKKKALILYLTLDGVAFNVYYSGLQISPQGELSINATRTPTSAYGIPTPLQGVPFVYEPPCGAFWQFNSSVSLCNQDSVLSNFTGVIWNGKYYSSNSTIHILFA